MPARLACTSTNQLSEGAIVNKAINRVLGVATLALGLALAGSALAEPKPRAPAAQQAEQAVAQETVNINTADAATLARVLQGLLVLFMLLAEGLRQKVMKKS